MLPILTQHYQNIEQLRGEFWSIIATATPEQRNFKPTPNDWCMLQVAQHIIASESGTLNFVTQRARLKNTTWGKIKSKCNALALKILLALPLKFKAPKVEGLSPKEIEPYATVENRWATVRESWRQYLDDFKAEHLQDIVFKHPKAGKFTLLQTLDGFMAAHIKHHIQQLNRIKADPNFPR